MSANNRSQKTIPSTSRARTSRKPEADGIQVDEKMITTGDIDDELEDFDLQGTIFSNNDEFSEEHHQVINRKAEVQKAPHDDISDTDERDQNSAQKLIESSDNDYPDDQEVAEENDAAQAEVVVNTL